MKKFEKMWKNLKKCETGFFRFFHIFSSQSGFTFVELILVIGVLAVIFGMSTLSLANFRESQSLESDRGKVVQVLREARTYAVSDYHNSPWGLRLNTAADPDEFILFQGASFALRDTAFDYVQVVQPSVDFQNIALNGGVSEVVFDQRTGATPDYGSFELATDTDSKSIEINELGLINPKF